MQQVIGAAAAVEYDQFMEGFFKKGIVDFRAVYREHVDGRLLVYLDTNVYIHLTQIRTDAARKCLDACRRAKKSGAVVFPLSYALVSELFDQKRSQRLVERAALMDELSDGVCFRASQYIYDIEARAAWPMLFGNAPRSPDRSEVFTYVIDHLADGSMLFPKVQGFWTDERIRSFLDFFHRSGAVKTVSWLLANLDVDAVRARHEEFWRRRQPELAASYERAAQHARDPNGKLNKDKALLEEQLSIFSNRALPAIRKILMEGRSADEITALTVAAQKASGEGSKKRMRELMRAMPATGQCCDVIAMRVMNPSRAYKDGDFWDIDHAEVPPVYVDAFVTCDTELADILRRCDAPKRRNCEIISSLEDLAAWLEQRALL